MPDPDQSAGDAESSSGLLAAVKRLFDPHARDRSLRAQLEEAIDEHEEDESAGNDAPGDGDLSPVERQMLRNLLHFSEHDADDVAIPRSEIIAVEATISWDELVRSFSDYVNRVAYRRERFILLKGRKPVAELRPLPAGRLLGELEEVLRSLPGLSEGEAADFAADIEDARTRLPPEGKG